MTALVPRGSRIAIVAPAGRFAAARLEGGLAWLRTHGWEPVKAPNLDATSLYHAGTAAERGADLLWALTSPQVDAVWAVRGGAGCSHLLPLLVDGNLQPRPLIGFSDITALLVALDQQGWTAKGGALVHGPVLHTLGAAPDEGQWDPLCVDRASRDALTTLLSTGMPVAVPAQQVAGPAQAVEAPLTGGNLTVLASLCGTPWALQARGRIVVLEDIGEAPYRIDRSLTQLLHSGSFDGAVGVVLGDWTGCEATSAGGQRYGGAEVATTVLGRLGIPVWAGAAIGHGVRNLAWPLGRRAVLGGDGLSWPGGNRSRATVLQC